MQFARTHVGVLARPALAPPPRSISHRRAQLGGRRACTCKQRVAGPRGHRPAHLTLNSKLPFGSVSSSVQRWPSFQPMDGAWSASQSPNCGRPPTTCARERRRATRRKGAHAGSRTHAGVAPCRAGWPT
eukprot:350521-Chlamydomonas_euryale.AAC.18